MTKLGLSTVPTFTTTRGIDGNIIMEARDSRKTDIDVEYFSYLKDVTERECLVVPMQAYDLVLGLPWFRKRDPEINWSNGQLLCLRNPQGSDSYRASHGDAHLSQRDTHSSSREDFTSSREVFTTRSTQVGETLMDFTPNHPIVEVGKPDHPMADVGNTDDRGDVRKHGSGNAIHIEMLSAVSICAFLRKRKDASAYVLRCADERGTGICTDLQSYTEGPHNRFQGMLPISF